MNINQNAMRKSKWQVTFIACNDYWCFDFSPVLYCCCYFKLVICNLILVICGVCHFQGDLHSYVRVRKRLREPEAKRLFRQMCEVVKSCHEQGIVLRDLKLRKFVFADAER